MKKNSPSHLRMGFCAVSALAFLASCQQGASRFDPLNSDNLVVSGPNTQRVIGDSKSQFLVLGKDRLSQQLFENKILSPQSPAAIELLSSLSDHSLTADDDAATPETKPASSAANKDTSLVLGFPIGLLHQEQVFGGVITQVSDQKNASLGQLKLADLPPVHVRAEVVQTAQDKYVFALVGCADSCSETSEQKVLLGVPVVSVDAAKQLVMVDLAPLGDGMNLVEMLDPEGAVTQLKSKSSKTVSFDYSFSTLVFDVEGTMVPVSSKDPNAPETVFTTRWYLKLASAFNPAFEARPAADGVGFFMTQRSAKAKIERVARPIAGSDLSEYLDVHYYVKNVPDEFKPAFSAAFDEWNEKFTDLMGKKLLTYEFVDATDPKAKLLVTGDPRFHIVEWDLVNQAPYGGLGPSMANQFTGEIFSANVLIQGPTIVSLYKKWFAASQQAQALRLAGRDEEATTLLADTQRSLQAGIQDAKATRLSLSVSPELPFRITSQIPSLEDPAMDRADFDEVPAGYTYSTYMAGYFHDMLAHELGHNLGLRHNFRGNLQAGDVPEVGNVSASIMEYLGRGYRHLSRIGSYDLMAISYGYLGVKPTVTNLYCTDEQVGDTSHPQNSAECSRDDATNDPFSFFTDRLTKAVNLLLAKTSSAAPTWKEKDVDNEITTDLTGLLLYATSAEATGDTWTNFFKKGDRPANKSDVKQYVLGKVKKEVCDSTVSEAITIKATPEARTATLANLGALRTKVLALAKAFNVYSEKDLNCAE